ncbi:MAG: hypothetical protein QM811_21940 [Pirellulales bacterium]
MRTGGAFRLREFLKNFVPRLVPARCAPLDRTVFVETVFDPKRQACAEDFDLVRMRSSAVVAFAREASWKRRSHAMDRDVPINTTRSADSFVRRTNVFGQSHVAQRDVATNLIGV